MMGSNDAQARATEHVAQVMNHGWLCLLMSVGERLGLHDALADLGPVTAQRLADETRTDPRYVEEWLWGMVAGGIIVASDDDEPVFTLPAAYIPVLTSRGGPLHWSRITTQITALSQLEDPLVAAFGTGQGLPDSSYEGRIADVLAGESGPIFEKVLIHEVLPLTGRVADLERGITVADLGCGTGAAAILIARTFPHSRVIGVDQSPSALERAREAAAGLDNITFVLADLEEDLGIDTADIVLAANVAHDLSDPARFFERVRGVLRPGGLFYLHELSATTRMQTNVLDPHAVGILTFSIYHCLPLAKRRPGIAPGGMWGRERYIESLHAAGFSQVDVHRAPSDPNNDTIFAS